MKKFLLSLALTVFAVSAVHVSAAPAVVVKEFDCGGFVPNPNTENGLPPLAGIFTTQTQGVAVVGKVGKVSCYFDHDVDLPNAAAATDFICSVPSPVNPDVILIADSQVMLATPGGKATLQCKFGPAKGKPQPPQP